MTLDFGSGDSGYLRELAEFVAVPSISREAPPAVVRSAADWLAGQLAFARGRVAETAGRPVVLGEWLGAAGAPTILVYRHYDVQPTGDLAEWVSPPFELIRRHTAPDHAPRGVARPRRLPCGRRDQGRSCRGRAAPPGHRRRPALGTRPGQHASK